MFPKPLKLLVFVVSLLLLPAWIPQALAGQAKLAWNATTTHTDGSAATDLAGYRLYSWPGTATPPPSTRVLVYQGQLTTYTDTRTALVEGSTHSYAVVAYDTAGKESAYSNVLPVTIASVNRAPSASADTSSATAGTPTPINVLANDTDADGNPLIITAVTQGVKGGTVTIGSGGTGVTYKPPTNFVGTDTFTYTISDGKGGIATGTVTVNVLAGNQPPVAVNDTITTTVGVPVIIAVVANDSDPDGTTPTLVPIPAGTRTAHGTLSSSGTSVTYTPDANYVGPDSFTYTISDGKGGTATATVTVTVLPNRAASLVAAYSFNEGSGTTVADASAYNNKGTLGSGVTWSKSTEGKFGSALVFDGASFVTIPAAASLNLATAMTLEAWVFPTATPTSWSTILMKEQPGQMVYTLYAGSPTNRPSVYFNVSTASSGQRSATGPAALPLNAWSHVAATYDGATLRFYVNGTLVTSQAVTGAIRTSTGALRIGGNSIWGEYFRGRIDEVRIYNTVLSLAEINADMQTAIAATTSVNRAPSATADTSSATAGTPTPINVLANDTDADGNPLIITAVTQGVKGGTVTIGSGGTGVTYKPPTNFVGTDTFTYTISDGKGGIATGTVTVNVLAGNQPPVAVNDTITTTVGVPVIIAVVANDSDPDGTTPTLVPIPAGTRTAHGTLSSSGTSVTYTPDANYVGPDSFTYTISDGKGGTATATVTVTVLPNRAASLVAAYSFNEGSGTTVADASAYNNKGTLGSGVTWSKSTEGKFGSALVFDGASFVTIPAAASLNLATAMTLEAWVFPTATPTSWSTILMKEQPGQMVYTLYAGAPTNRPSVYFNVSTASSGERGATGPAALPLNAWSHVAATYDGATLRFYVNGTLVTSQTATGAIRTSTGALRIGGNSIWGEYFRGRIDEVRIYNTVLSLAEINADMGTPLK